MSESIYSDPVAPQRGGVRISATGDSAARPERPSKIVSRWWLIVICVAIGIVVSFVYFALAPKVYTARSVLSAEIEGGAVAGNVAPDEFLFQQRDLIQSPPVRAAAATTLITSDAKIRDALNVAVSKGEGVVTIAYSAGAADEAARGANTVAEAYLRSRAQQQTSATSGLSDLTKQRDQLAADRRSAENALRDLRQTSGAAGNEADRAAAARLEQLQQAITVAESEVASATAAANAGKQLLADPKNLRAVVEANRGKGIFDRLETERTATESELAQLEAQLEKQRKSMLPEHPVVIATQRKIEQARTTLADLDKKYAGVYADYQEQQRATAQKRVDELKQLIAAQSTRAKVVVDRAAKAAQAEAQLKKFDAATAEVDKKIRDVTLTSGAAAAPSVKVIVPAQPPARPTSPKRDRIIGSGAILGLVVGLALAAVLPKRQTT
jgi:uncharacterized protein involved in exopolysaccharide biosynthesis